MGEAASVARNIDLKIKTNFENGNICIYWLKLNMLNSSISLFSILLLHFQIETQKLLKIKFTLNRDNSKSVIHELQQKQNFNLPNTNKIYQSKYDQT